MKKVSLREFFLQLHSVSTPILVLDVIGTRDIYSLFILTFLFDLVSFTFFISLHFQSIPSLYLCSSRRSQHTGSECSGMSSVSRDSRNTREVSVGEIIG